MIEINGWVLLSGACAIAAAGFWLGHLKGVHDEFLRWAERDRWIRGDEDLNDPEVVRRLTLMQSAAEKAVEDSKREDRPRAGSSR